MKYFYSIILISTFFFSGFNVYAMNTSNVQSLSASVLGPYEVELNANINIDVDEDIEFWFEYGTDPSFLNKKTQHTTWQKGFHFVSENITELSSGVEYYYVGVIDVDRDIFKTNPRSFQTFSSEIPGSIESDQDTEIPNPLNYFSQDNTNQNSADLETEDSKITVEYTDDPVGGVIHDESVYFTDEEGEVIEYSDEYRNALVQNKRTSNNGEILVIIILILLLVLFILYRKIYIKKQEGYREFNQRYKTRPKFKRIGDDENSFRKPLKK